MAIVEKILKNAYIGEVWTPWSNTIAYFPLETDQLDHKGSLTLPVTWTKQTIWYLFNTNQSWVQVHSSATKFINFWINIQSINAANCLCWSLLWWYVFHYRNHGNTLTNKFWIFTWSWGSGAVTSNQVSMTTSVWYNVCVWYDSNGSVWYLNWVNVFTTSSTPYAWGDEAWAFGTWNWNKQWSAIISEMILEDRVRTSQEILNYYNWTKSKYWL